MIVNDVLKKGKYIAKVFWLVGKTRLIPLMLFKRRNIYLGFGKNHRKCKALLYQCLQKDATSLHDVNKFHLCRDVWVRDFVVNLCSYQQCK